MQYLVKSGDSPATIARRFGVSRQALINANPHKPRTIVAGQHTWQGIRSGETVRVPVGVGDGFLGVTPAAPGGSHPQIKRYAGSPPDQVALWQTLIGIAPDGVFGAGTETATKAWQGAHGLSADGIVGPASWAKALGGGGGGGAAPAPTVTFAAPAASSSVGLAATAAAAAAALTMDAGYCTSVAKSGTAVNTAVHNFKAAWNSANPGQKVPIGTGKYEPVVAAALSSALGGIPVPPGCGGAAAPAIAPQMPSIPSAIPTSLPTAAGVPTALQALASIDPCYSGNAAMVCAAQAALGLAPDGKYGPGTAAALRRFVPNAPGGCVGPPLWWGKTSDNKCGGAMPAMPALPAIPAALPGLPAALPGLPTVLPTTNVTPSPGWQATAPTTTPAAAAYIPPTPDVTSSGATPSASAAGGGTTTPGGPAQPVVVAPADKGLSTGTMVAGGLGLAALVGIVAVAASGKKSSTTRTTTTRPARRKPSKPAHKRK